MINVECGHMCAQCPKCSWLRLACELASIKQSGWLLVGWKCVGKAVKPNARDEHTRRPLGASCTANYRWRHCTFCLQHPQDWHETDCCDIISHNRLVDCVGTYITSTAKLCNRLVVFELQVVRSDCKLLCWYNLRHGLGRSVL